MIHANLCASETCQRLTGFLRLVSAQSLRNVTYFVAENRPLARDAVVKEHIPPDMNLRVRVGVAWAGRRLPWLERVAHHPARSTR